MVEKLSTCITQLEEIKQAVAGEYADNLKEILKEFVVIEAVECLDDNEGEELGDTEDENCEDNEIIEQFILRYFFLSRFGVINFENDSAFYFLWQFSCKKLALNRISHGRGGAMLPSINLEITSKLLEVFGMKICPSKCEISCKNTPYEIGLTKTAVFKIRS